MARADHIFVNRLGYTHHGIDLGDGSVIHYTGELGQKTDAVVRQTPIEEFAKNSPIQVRHYGTCDPPDIVIERAIGRLGEKQYHIVFCNCEHFATWCKTGSGRSEQVENASTAARGTVASGTAVAASLGTVGASGAVAGLSAPGIMSGLATVGGLVGGGAAAGIALVGAAPVTLTSAVMMRILRDDEVLHEGEREARKVGRYATLVAGLGGPLASVGAVAAAGTSGLSAAGITSGLAAVGGIVGGGMAAGVFVTTAAPALAASAVGYSSYRLWKRWHRRRESDAANA